MNTQGQLREMIDRLLLDGRHSHADFMAEARRAGLKDAEDKRALSKGISNALYRMKQQGEILQGEDGMYERMPPAPTEEPPKAQDKLIVQMYCQQFEKRARELEKKSYIQMTDEEFHSARTEYFLLKALLKEAGKFSKELEQKP